MGSVLTNSESGRSRTKAVKAVSISLLAPTLTILLCRPMAMAAASTSLTMFSVTAALPGLTSTAIRMAAGSSSRSSSNRFADNSVPKKIGPSQVAAGAGEAGDKTSLDGIVAGDENDGDRRGCCLGRQYRSGTSGRGNDSDLSAN